MKRRGRSRSSSPLNEAKLIAVEPVALPANPKRDGVLTSTSCTGIRHASRYPARVQERTRLEMWCDYTADPIWRRVHGETSMVSLESLPISEDLRQALRAWARAWERMSWPPDERRKRVDPAEWGAFVEVGRNLRNQLEEALGPSFEVELRYRGV